MSKLTSACGMGQSYQLIMRSGTTVFRQASPTRLVGTVPASAIHISSVLHRCTVLNGPILGYSATFGGSVVHTSVLNGPSGLSEVMVSLSARSMRSMLGYIS